MNSEEYANLVEVENHHWFYSGKRAIARHWITQSGKLIDSSKLIDCGAGTGVFASEMQSRCQVLASDDYPESLELLRCRLGNEKVVAGSCTKLPLESDEFDFVTALDVLEHIEDDNQALSEIYRITKPGGTVVLTVPALMSLWSDWDITLRHYRRYNISEFRSLVERFDFEIININYMNFFAFPAVWLFRKLRSIKGGESDHRAEDKISREPLNSILRSIFILSSCQTLIRWPFGVGILAVLKKR